MSTLKANDALGMVRHWIGTEPNGYLGSSYGADTQSLLQTPQQSGLADAFLAKARVDIPLLGVLPPDAVNLYSYPFGFEGKQIVIELLGDAVDVGLSHGSF